MYIEQLYTNCLAEAAYYIESEGEAVIIDPIRDVKPYLEMLKSRKASLKYIFETHFHADFVSGHVDLAKETGAEIVFGPLAETKYKSYSAKDGEEFKFGKVKLIARHTPGHTPESTCFLLVDVNGKEHSIFTGDTLFVGDVGRPDLLDGKMSKEELAGMLYESLNTKIKILPDDVIVYPAHGPGSACGKNIGKETWSTIGEQKQKNYALQDQSKEEFIKAVTEGLTTPPKYFFEDAKLNKVGYSNIDQLLEKSIVPLSARDFKALLSENKFVVLDTRTPDDFEKDFIPGSINIGLNGSFAIWAGTLINISTSLLIVAEPGKEEESILRLARVGYENVNGYLKGGIDSWKKEGFETDKIKSITPQDFVKKMNDQDISIVDVRKPGEFEAGSVTGALNLSLADFEGKMHQLNKENTHFVHCAGGYRSMIAASFLKKNGYNNIVNVYGGFGKIKESGAPLSSTPVEA